jgi:antitoxin MazE
MISMMIRSKVVKIGNSRGIRIPRTILEQIGLTDEVEMKVEGNQLIIRAPRHPRQGWEDRFSAMAEQGDDQLCDETFTTQWDAEEWTW